MTPPPLPAPAIGDPPNVPADLGKVAQAIENQVVAAYAGYNTTSTPSATSIEARATAIDAAPGGTAAALDIRITSLNSAIDAWTGLTPSNLSTQAARTAAFPARQDGHDTAMSSLTSSLAGFEPQIAQVEDQRPKGLLVADTSLYNQLVNASNPIITHTTFTGLTPTLQRWYRVTFSGTVLSGGSAGTLFSAFISLVTGSTPSTSGAVGGKIVKQLTQANEFFPFTVTGLYTGLTAGATYTVAVCGANSPGVTIRGMCSYLLEDAGYRYY